MQNKITPEQSVKITEWLGCKVGNNHNRMIFDDCWLGPDGMELLMGGEYVLENEFPLWLSSPEGEVAMIRKILSEGFPVAFWHSKPGSIGCDIGKFPEECTEQFGSDENEALQLAILAMLEGE